MLTQVTDRNGRVLQSFSYTDADADGLVDELAAFTQADGHVATYTYDTNGLLSESSNGRGATYHYYYNADRTLDRTTAPPATPGGQLAEIFVVAENSRGSGLPAVVRVFNGQSGALLDEFDPFAGSYGGGLRIAAGDIDGDGDNEAIIGLPPNVGNGAVRVLDGMTGALVAAWHAFGTGYQNGMFFAAGDTDGDGTDEVVVGTGAGIAPLVRIFDVDGSSATLENEFAAFNGTYPGGVRVGVADGNLDGIADILVAPGGGANAFVFIHDAATGGILEGFWAFELSETNGTWIAGTVSENLPAPVTSYTYDKLGRVLTETNSLGQTTTYAYDDAGNLLSLTDAKGNTTSWVYDNLGRQISETNELGKTETYQYDLLGNLTRLTDRLGRIVEYVYDNLSRLISETWLAADGTTVENVITYTYDAWGRLDVVEDNYSKYDFDYDNLDRVTSIDNNGNPLNVPRTVLTNEYDLLGRRTSLSAGNPAGLADFINSYSYDAAGRMTSLTQAGQAGGRAVGEKRVDLAYDNLGRIDTITRYEDLLGTELVATSDYDFDLAGRLTSLAHTANAVLLASYTYNYDRLGRLTKETSSADGVRNYRYDVLGQLTRVHGDATESYSHDATGNRTGEDKENGANNRLLDDGTYTYLYDDNGNRLRKTEKATGEFEQYYWDHRNRLLGLTFHDANGTRTGILHYRYDVFDRRIARLADLDGVAGIEDREFYVYDAAPGKGGLDDIVLTFDTNQAVKHRYLHGPGIDQVFSDENVLNEILWSLADRQGSIENWVEYDAATDATSVAATISYDAFGVITSQTPGFEVFYAYTGRIWDGETGLYDFRTRIYDASAGRFASEDWIGFAGGQANLAAYVGNSPTNFTDPSGLQDASAFFGDGSVRDVSGNIDPGVLQQLEENGNGPQAPQHRGHILPIETPPELNGYVGDFPSEPPAFGAPVGDWTPSAPNSTWTPSQFFGRGSHLIQQTSWGCGGLAAWRAGLPIDPVFDLYHPMDILEVPGVKEYATFREARNALAELPGKGVIMAVQNDHENWDDFPGCGNFATYFGGYWEYVNEGGDDMLIKHRPHLPGGFDHTVYLVVPRQ